MTEQDFRWLYSLIVDYRLSVDEETFYENFKPSSVMTPDGLFYSQEEMIEFLNILKEKKHV